MSSSTLSCNLGSLSELSISPLKIIYAAINQVKPLFEVKKIRVAGATYQVPSLIKSGRQKNIGINWLIKSAFERKKKTSSQTISGIKMGRRGPKVPKLGENLEGFLAVEVFEAFQRQGQARNKRNELHKLAEQNRAFSHFRWW
jgi:small subunit ribosomal protein S7